MGLDQGPGGQPDQVSGVMRSQLCMCRVAGRLLLECVSVHADVLLFAAACAVMCPSGTVST